MGLGAILGGFRLFKHVGERQICECDFLGPMDFCRSGHIHPLATCVIIPQICGCDFFGRGAKISRSDGNFC